MLQTPNLFLRKEVRARATAGVMEHPWNTPPPNGRKLGIFPQTPGHRNVLHIALFWPFSSSMVRKGSSVRVRQRAWGKSVCLRGFLALVRDYRGPLGAEWKLLGNLSIDEASFWSLSVSPRSVEDVAIPCLQDVLVVCAISPDPEIVWASRRARQPTGSRQPSWRDGLRAAG